MKARQAFRMPDGGRIDRSRPIQFTFNGKGYEGYAGDTLASALLANGVRVVARSLKFHRPRGILSAGVEESNALVGVDLGAGVIPAVRATLMPLIEGLVAHSQNCFPSVNLDLGRVFDYTRRLWPAGFYNKTFIWPNWRTYEWAIRRLAGIGRLPEGVDQTRYRHLHAHCDVLVVGAGPAGLRIACEAAGRGEDVLIAEQDIEPGGSLLYDASEIDGMPPADWLSSIKGRLENMPNVRFLTRATVAACYDHNVLTIHDRSAAQRREDPVETFWKVRAGGVVLATGAIEQPLLFGNNDLPGIMLASAMHQFAGRYGVRCGKRIAGLVNNDLAWRSIFALDDHGTAIAAIVDMRQDVAPALRAGARDREIAVYAGAVPIRARGSSAVAALEFADADSRMKLLHCDGIAMSGGFSPTVHLYSHAGGTLRYDEGLGCFVPAGCRQKVEVVGAANGEFATPETYDMAARRRAPAAANTQWVDFLHDVTVADIDLAVRENFVSVEHLKRYTTAGMAADQGKTSNLNTLTLLAQLTATAPGTVGTTTFRPHFMPVTMGAIAGSRHGDFYAPARRLTAHDWHEAHGAVFDDYGGWKRPAYYGRERESCIEREVRRVRESAGLFDASPLGKIEIKGPDAAEFLERFYVNSVQSLKPGKLRYGLMLNENGVVLDDGVFARLADDHFLVNTTSGGADRIAAWLEEWHQCEWTDHRVVISNVTSQWGVATLAGPRARDILTALLPDIDLSSQRFPHMSILSERLEDGMQYRLQRVSYSGEQSFEISVAASCVTEILERLMDAGVRYDIGLFGIEALMVLRTEKGFLHVGVDTDGTTNALDIGFAGIIGKKKNDFVGARSLRRPEDRKPGRRQLVGFELENNSSRVRAGAHFVTDDGAGRTSEGFVTSAYRSPTLGKTIGLGLLERGFERKGEEIRIYDDGRIVVGRVVDTGFYDPPGERMHA